MSEIQEAPIEIVEIETLETLRGIATTIDHKKVLEKIEIVILDPPIEIVEREPQVDLIENGALKKGEIKAVKLEAQPELLAQEMIVVAEIEMTVAVDLLANPIIMGAAEDRLSVFKRNVHAEVPIFKIF